MSAKVQRLDAAHDIGVQNAPHPREHATYHKSQHLITHDVDPDVFRQIVCLSNALKYQTNGRTLDPMHQDNAAQRKDQGQIIKRNFRSEFDGVPSEDGHCVLRRQIHNPD